MRCEINRLWHFHAAFAFELIANLIGAQFPQQGVERGRDWVTAACRRVMISKRDRGVGRRGGGARHANYNSSTQRKLFRPRRYFQRVFLTLLMKISSAYCCSCVCVWETVCVCTRVVGYFIYFVQWLTRLAVACAPVSWLWLWFFLFLVAAHNSETCLAYVCCLLFSPFSLAFSHTQNIFTFICTCVKWSESFAGVSKRALCETTVSKSREERTQCVHSRSHGSYDCYFIKESNLN